MIYAKVTLNGAVERFNNNVKEDIKVGKLFDDETDDYEEILVFSGDYYFQVNIESYSNVRLTHWKFNLVSQDAQSRGVSSGRESNGLPVVFTRLERGCNGWHISFTSQISSRENVFDDDNQPHKSYLRGRKEADNVVFLTESEFVQELNCSVRAIAEAVKYDIIPD